MQGNGMFRKCIKFNMTQKNSSQRGRERKELAKDEGHEAEEVEWKPAWKGQWILLWDEGRIH